MNCHSLEGALCDNCQRPQSHISGREDFIIIANAIDDIPNHGIAKVILITALVIVIPMIIKALLHNRCVCGFMAHKTRNYVLPAVKTKHMEENNTSLKNTGYNVSMQPLEMVYCSSSSTQCMLRVFINLRLHQRSQLLQKERVWLRVLRNP